MEMTWNEGHIIGLSLWFRACKLDQTGERLNLSHFKTQMTSWLRHNDVTEDQKNSLTESRLETETNIHNLEKSEPGNIFLFLFQAMKGNFLTFACWKVIKKWKEQFVRNGNCGRDKRKQDQ